jgi:hypothetical protein
MPILHTTNFYNSFLEVLQTTLKCKMKWEAFSELKSTLLTDLLHLGQISAPPHLGLAAATVGFLMAAGLIEIPFSLPSLPSSRLLLLLSESGAFFGAT